MMCDTISGVVRRLHQKVLDQECHTSGHNVRNGERYVELRNVQLVIPYTVNWIIDAPEYEELVDGKWYDEHYTMRIGWQIQPVVEELIRNRDSRHAILMFYEPLDVYRHDMPCTMYVSLRLNDMSESHTGLTYTIHMRSSDIREFRSDLKYHRDISDYIALELTEKTGWNIVQNPMVLVADSLQCWDKDFEFLK